LNCPSKQSDCDPIPTWLLKICASVHTPTITNIVNLSLSSGQFHPILKESVISPIFKKPTLDKDKLSNYRPISNLSLIYSLSYLSYLISLSYHILTSLPTASITIHSTETALMYIHGHLINAVGSQKLSCLCLLDFSVAFDTIDHSILISRLLSWFVIHGSVLNWFKSYLTSRSFRVKCDKDFSSEHISSCGVPQGYVLGPLLFVMYTTPLSTLISSLSLNDHLYADDTQHFSRSILATLTQVSPTSRLSIPLILHATLVLSLMKILLPLIRSHHFLSPGILIFVSSAVYR